MIDNAAVIMAQGVQIAVERKEGVNDNMNTSHFHAFFEIYFLEDGSREFVVDGTLYRIHPLSAVLLPPNVLHYSYGLTDQPFRRIVVYFREDVLPPALYQHLCRRCGVFSFQDEEQCHELQHLIHAILDEEENHHDSLSMQAKKALLELLVILILRLDASRVEPINTGKIRKVVRYLNDHYHEDISLDKLAQHFFISKFHLCREFKKYTQNTIVEYLNFVRIIHAQRLFMETTLNLSEIAHAVGFSSLTHFERVFFKMTQERPTDRRRQILQNKADSGKKSSSGAI